MTSKYFNPEKSFLSLGVVRLAIGLIGLISIVVTAVITWKSGLVFCGSYDCFNNAVDIFKVPIGILALIIPIVALLAANHRSEQTKQQIKAALDQNKISNHFKNLLEFERYCRDVINKPKQCITDIRTAYNIVYPNSREGNIYISKEFILSFDESIRELVHLYGDRESNDCSEWDKTAESILLHTRSVLIFNCFQDDHLNVISSAGTGFWKSMGFLNYFFWEIEAISELLKFDTNYTPSSLVTAVVNFDREKIPNGGDIELGEDFDLASELGLHSSTS